MSRVGFMLKVRNDRINEYRAAHAEVWPEMLDALHRTGWRNSTLFLSDDGTLFGYFETDGSFPQALAGMAAEPVNARWQASMAPFFEGSGRAADTMMQQLDEVFHLD